MRQAIFISTVLAVVLSCGALAEIYETTDSEGNKVFTDTPPSSDAKVVDLPEANIAESVEPAAQPEAGQRPAAGQQQEQGEYDDDGVYIIGDADNERLESKIAREKRREVLEGEPRKEVLEAEQRHEVLDAETPRESGEAEALRHKDRAVESAPHRAPHAVHDRR
jgi:hypothetical protein